MVPGRYSDGGLACRLRHGDPYDVPGPNIAGWLCHPGGRLRPDALDGLRRLAERHGVVWRDYVPAEVM